MAAAGDDVTGASDPGVLEELMGEDEGMNRENVLKVADRIANLPYRKTGHSHSSPRKA